MSRFGSPGLWLANELGVQASDWLTCRTRPRRSKRARLNCGGVAGVRPRSSTGSLPSWACWRSTSRSRRTRETWCLSAEHKSWAAKDFRLAELRFFISGSYYLFCCFLNAVPFVDRSGVAEPEISHWGLSIGDAIPTIHIPVKCKQYVVSFYFEQHFALLYVHGLML